MIGACARRAVGLGMTAQCEICWRVRDDHGLNALTGCNLRRIFSVSKYLERIDLRFGRPVRRIPRYHARKPGRQDTPKIRAFKDALFREGRYLQRLPKFRASKS